MAEFLTVQRAGMSCVQDLGRPGSSRLGFPANGALDQYSARVANVLVGNDERAPLIEITALDFSGVASADILVAVTGAPADVTVGGFPRPQWEPVPMAAGQTIAVADIRAGLRVYLAVLGSLAEETLLGSCSPDPVLAFGRILSDNAVLGIHRSQAVLDHPFSRHPLFRLAAPRPRFTDPWTVDATDGPDAGQFDGCGQLLFRSEYTMTPRSNQIGLRMQGTVPDRIATGEVLSRGVPVGAVEIPAGGEVLVLHRGRGVTAGYPVLAVVSATGLSNLGQVRPGQRVRFRRRTVREAVASYRAQCAAIDALRHRVTTAFRALGIPICGGQAAPGRI